MTIRTHEEQLEMMAFLQLINIGKKEIVVGTSLCVDDFFTDSEAAEIESFSTMLNEWLSQEDEEAWSKL